MRQNQYNYLFSDIDLSGALRGQEQKMLAEIDAVAADRLLNTSPDALADYFAEKFAVDCPILNEAGRSADQTEVHIPQRGWRGDEIRVPAVRVSVFIPFEGEGDLFLAQPDWYTSSPPVGKVHGNELVFEFDQLNHDADQIKIRLDRDLGEVRKYLNAIGRMTAEHNRKLPELARRRIAERREKLLKDRGLVAELGIPMRRREGHQQTYAVPTVRRKLPPSLPPASTAPFAPEPALGGEEYEHILSVIQGMVKVIERSPDAFVSMGEENLRQHFLVQLNGHYEGRATGETFNFQGKTDILIREGDRNVFIGECKFWKGQEAFSKTIDQLLGYLAWRDTKAAIILFNKNKDLTAVLGKVQETVKAHPNFLREAKPPAETEFRYVMNQPRDKGKELHLAVLVFDVPSKP